MFGLDNVWHWLILLAIVLLLFGAGKLRHVGRDLGTAIAGFRKGLKDGEAGTTETPALDGTVANDKPKH